MHTDNQPAADEILRSERLQNLLMEQILAEGGVSFEHYMETALYHPDWGYYTAGAEIFGPQGDFVTAPTMTPFFGRCLAVQLAEVITPHPDWRLLEFGAGSGALAVEVLSALEQFDALPAGYDIVERSPELCRQQRELLTHRLPHLIERVRWLQAPPYPYRGVVIANELLDALPVERVIKTETGWSRIVVTVDGAKLQLTSQPLHDSSLTERFAGMDLPDGYHTEVNPAAEKWLGSLAEVIEEGLVLLIDYGYGRAEYYHPQRREGTFLCYFRHTAADDPLRYPGLQDMTAHVDFTALAEAAHSAGMEVAGFTTQAKFLINCGILEQLAEISEGAGYVELLAPVKQLLLPGGMGEVFKVMALTRDYSAPLRGLATGDLRHTL